MSNKYVDAREKKAAALTGRNEKQNPPSVLVRVSAIFATLLLIVAILLFYQIDRSQRLPQQLQLRSLYAQAEMRLRSLAQARENYVTCLAHSNSCGVKISVFEEAVRGYPGIAPDQFSFDATQFELVGFLKAKSDFSPHPISIQLPKDIFTVSRSNCSLDQPLLIGFDESGKPLCKALSNAECERGQYISSIDPSTLQIQCSPLGKEIECAAGELLSSFEWQGEDRVIYTCRPRQDPFIAWNFKPQIRVGEALNDNAPKGER